MSFTAKYQFDKNQVELMDVTISLTASLCEWRVIAGELKQLAGNNSSAPVQHCISNIIDAIETATGGSYRTQGYKWEPAAHLATPPEVAQ